VSLSRSRAFRIALLLTAVVAPAAAAQAKADSSQLTFVPADAEFMTGMIAHHAQAVLIAGWAPSHGASPSVQTLCERIVVGQQDEIALMQRWLAERKQPVPDPSAPHAMMPGMDHGMAMPGMLSAEQLTQLDQSRGPEFDRLFLTFMIQHHLGAITMVDRLFESQGATQDETSFRLASNIYADQTTEITRMQKMLASLPAGETTPK
jgi:uncharacterized protein (DUF305 family)